jgi:pyruvate,water dikinase
MTSIHTVLSASPFADLLIQSFDHFVGYNDGKKAKEQSSTWKQKGSFLFAFIQRNRLLEKDVVTFEKRALHFDEQVKSAIVLHDFQKSFHDFVEIRMHSWYHASLADFFAMSFHGFLGKFCQLHFGEQGTGIQNQLIQAIPNLISSQPVLSMHALVMDIRNNASLSALFQEKDPSVIWERVRREVQWQFFYEHVDLYLQNWGYRCSGELMLTHLNYIEDPASLMSLLKQMLALPDYDPAKKMREKHTEALAVRAQFRRKLWMKYWYRPGKLLLHLFLLKYLIGQACKGISSRERVRLKQAQLYFGLKRSLQSIGREWRKSGFLDSEMDILYFTYQELAEHLSASGLLGSEVKSLIAMRKKLWEEQVKNQYPDDFYTREGRYEKVSEVVSKENQHTDGQLAGLCACGGIIKGRVKVLENVLEAGKLEQGDILVTRQTDPGWVTVFPLISGLIVERGGMLSHGAIVSREFGIPAIVGVHEATLRLKDGDQITLNANMGIIIIHD